MLWACLLARSESTFSWMEKIKVFWVQQIQLTFDKKKCYIETQRKKSKQQIHTMKPLMHSHLPCELSSVAAFPSKAACTSLWQWLQGYQLDSWEIRSTADSRDALNLPNKDNALQLQRVPHNIHIDNQQSCGGETWIIILPLFDPTSSARNLFDSTWLDPRSWSIHFQTEYQ